MLAMMEHAKQVRAEVVAAQKQEELEWAASDTASIAAALELQEAEAAAAAERECEAALRLGLELDARADEEEAERVAADEEVAARLSRLETAEAADFEAHLEKLSAADEQAAKRLAAEMKVAEAKLLKLEERSEKLALKLVERDDFKYAAALAEEILSLIHI